MSMQETGQSMLMTSFNAHPKPPSRPESQPFYREDGTVVGAEVVRKIKEGFIVRDPNTGIEVRHTEDKIREILRKIGLA